MKKFSLEEEKLLRQKGYIQFAQIGRPHGLKGAFFLKTPDRRSQWDGYKSLLLEMPEGFFEAKVAKTYNSGQALAINLEGFTTREQIEPLYNKSIYVHESEIPVAEGEFIVGKLIGYKVYTENKGLIGRIEGVSSFGAQDNLEIYVNKYKKVFLYPFLDNFVTNISESEQKIEIKYVPEFLEEESE
ncbi:ribosome maturation factor RimM [Pigmentibacter sp. JX0631]|uniref:ribosome maturation factor RimM n=1 Tax=Pigmentibacter sp. JX0631 TaxID=2976982 RepID=UPI0024692C62|nr:ribosome maturation factor RimM [Pigmentibacter sp. JX0631]WGL58884.1 ribosome maturation factor RimM [Pigmentibacter sp. JX0631]